MAVAKLEFAVQMTCDSCGKSVEGALKDKAGIMSFDINVDKQLVMVESTLQSDTIKQYIESTGRRAVLMGTGSNKGREHLGAAVAEISGGSVAGEQRKSLGVVRGVIRMIQIAQSLCVIEGTIDGLPQGRYQVDIHEYGDVSKGCESCGDVFQGIIPLNNSKEHKYGTLSVVETDSNGRCQFRFESPVVQVWDVIGRSMVIKSQIGQGYFKRLACGIIARSSGVQENSKRICACDGIVLWDERDHPIAGPNRKEQTTASL